MAQAGFLCSLHSQGGRVRQASRGTQTGGKGEVGDTTGPHTIEREVRQTSYQVFPYDQHSVAGEGGYFNGGAGDV